MLTPIQVAAPNVPLAVVTASLFGISTIAHLAQAIYYKTRYFSPFIIGSFMMTLGYIFRALSSFNPDSLALTTLQSLFIILPPTLYAATLYMTYSRIVVLINDKHASLLRPANITNFFVCLDMFSFLAQAGGGGMSAVKSMAVIGERLELLGFAIQIASFGMFLLLAGLFLYRTWDSFEETALKKYERYHWRSLLWVLIVTAVLILMRCCYRIAEFSQGYRGFLMRHEGYAYLLDALPMLVVQVLLHVVHPGMVFPGRNSEYAFDKEYMKMTGDHNRRDFIRRSIAVAGGAKKSFRKSFMRKSTMFPSSV